MRTEEEKMAIFIIVQQLFLINRKIKIQNMMRYLYIFARASNYKLSYNVALFVE
jgi:hypothetical protein